MTGNSQVRHCAQCDRDVYNFTEMTTAQIERVIAAANRGRVCGRLYERADGTILTRDCPVGARARIRKVTRRISALLAAAMSFACTARAFPQQDGSTLGDVMIAQSGLRLSVVSKSGSAVPEAQITVTARPSRKVVTSGKTDARGQLSLPLDPGDYSMIVQKAGLISQTVLFSVRQHQMNPVSVTMPNANFVMGIVAAPVRRQKPVEGNP